MTRDADLVGKEGNYQTTRPLARRLAELKLSPGVVIAIAVGGAVFVFVALSIIMVVVLRVRQRHQLAISRTARRRRLSMYTGGLPVVGENSYAQGPRPRNVLRRNSHAPYMPNSGWRAISSRESLPHKPLLNGLSRAFVVDARQSKQDRPRRSWPLPTRHKLGSAIPLAHLEGSPLSAITERSANNTAPSPDVGRIAELPAENSPRLTPEKNSEQKTMIDQNGFHPEIRPTTSLTPKPLFHGYDSKRSAERVSQFSAVEKYESIGSIMDPVQSGASLERPTRPRPLSRSVSFCSQQSGLAPDEPMPPLPLRTPATVRHRQYNDNPEGSPSRYSSASYETANSSILADRSFSQTGTDLTSDLASPPLSFSTSNDPRKLEAASNPWNPGAMTNLDSPHGRTILRGFNHDQLLAMSTRIRDTQYSCSRDSSSALSMNLAEQLDSAVPRRAQSNASRFEGLNREMSRRYGDYCVRTPTPNGRDAFGRRHSYYGPHPSRRSSYQSSVSDTTEDPRSKRASTSALQDVSGNQMSPMRSQSQRRPYSLPASNVCLDSRLLIRPSALKGGSGFRPPRHKRQNCVRISTIAPITIGPTTFPPTVEEPEGTPEAPTHKPRIPGLTLSKSHPHPHHHPLPQPPSSATFDPQISPSSDYAPTCQALPLPPEGTHYPTHSIMTLYPISPTKRSRADSEESIFTTKADHTPDRTKHLSSISSIWSAHGIPTPTMRSFPNPPLTTRDPNPTDYPHKPAHPPPLFQPPLPSTPTPPPRNRDRDRTRSRSRTPSVIHGPRSQPPRSPARSPAMKHTHTQSPSDGRDLRRNVLALRRMNGEIGTTASSVVGAKRALRMGSPSQSPSPSPLGRCGDGEREGGLSLETEVEVEEEGRPRKVLRSCGDDGGAVRRGWERGGEPVTPKKAVVGLGLGTGTGVRVPWGTPGSLYDRDGFLKGED